MVLQPDHEPKTQDFLCLFFFQDRELNHTLCSGTFSRCLGSALLCHGRTLSLRKPILSMFSTLGTPSAMLRSPSESPIRMMLQYSFSCLKYSVFRRAPSCLLYTWISSPLKPFRTPCEMRSRSDQRGESQDHDVFLKSWDQAATQAEGQKLCNNSRCRQSPWSWRRPWRWGGRLRLGGWFPPGRRPDRRRRWRQAHCAAAGGRRTAQSLPWQDSDKQHFSILVVLNHNLYLEGGYTVFPTVFWLWFVKM